MVKYIAISLLLVGCIGQVETSEFDIRDQDADTAIAPTDDSQPPDAGAGDELNTMPCQACCTEACRSSNQLLWHPTPPSGGAHSIQ
jgi:hypothetical protein